MIWYSLYELDLCLGLLMVIIYGLTNLRYRHLNLADVHFACQSLPLLVILGLLSEASTPNPFTHTQGLAEGIGLGVIGLKGETLISIGVEHSFDVLLALITVVVLRAFKSFESLLLMLFAYVAQAFMMHSCDLVSFYISLEAQNFCFLVLCGLQPDKRSNGFSVEASIKYLLLSAFSSGVLLFCFAAFYLHTGMAGLFLKTAVSFPTPLPFASASQGNPLPLSLASWPYPFRFAEGVQALEVVEGVEGTAITPLGLEAGYPVPSPIAKGNGGVAPLTPNPFTLATELKKQDGGIGVKGSAEAFLILLALLFKLGSAPVHLWVVYIYQSIKRPLLMYISTAPKLALFSFWASAWQLVWTDYTLSVFIVYTLVLGSLGAYGFASQPAVRALFAYSTISEIGFMLLAAETAGFHTLFQHLSIYILTQLLVWNLSDKRLFSLCAISLAGLPPLAGFFGKAWIFFHSVTMHMVTLLIIAVLCTIFSIIYYIRLLRLFWNLPTGQTLGTLMYALTSNRAIGLTKNSYHINSSLTGLYSPTFERQVGLTSACLIALIFLPLFLIKPFVL